MVQDGNSSDETLDILKSEERFPLKWNSAPDQGVYDAMNKAIQDASGHYFIFLGADDAFASSRSLDLFREQIQTRAPQMVSGCVRYVDRENRLVPKVHRPGFGAALRWRNRIHHQGTAYHRSLFEQGSYDLTYPILGDYHFNLKCWKHFNARCVLLDEEIALADARGLSKNFRWRLYSEELRLKRTVLSSAEMIPQYPWVVIKYLAKRLSQRT